MKRPPRRAEVDGALKAAESEVAASLKALNEQAASLLAKGDYAGAEQLVNVGRNIQAFRRRLMEIRREWRDLGIKAADQGNGTPMWEFYRPILRTLVELGGEARRVEFGERPGTSRCGPPATRGRTSRWRKPSSMEKCRAPCSSRDGERRIHRRRRPNVANHRFRKSSCRSEGLNA